MELTLERLTQFKDELLIKIRNEANADLLGPVEACRIELNNRMRTRAGTAHLSKNRIQMNVRLLSKNPEHIEQTFAHELAHLIAWALYRESGHGRVWKGVMRRLGYPPDRTHDLDCTGLQRKQKPIAIATCKCGQHLIKKRKLNKILNGTRYRCVKCLGYLVLTFERPELNKLD